MVDTKKNINGSKDKELHVPIDKEIVEKLEQVKDYHGIKNNTEIIRFLITKEFREISAPGEWIYRAERIRYAAKLIDSALADSMSSAVFFSLVR